MSTGFPQSPRNHYRPLKRRRPIIVLALCFGVVLSTGITQSISAQAQQPSSSVTTTQILERYIQALGGTAAVNSVKAIEAKGTFELPRIRIQGTLEFYSKVPNKTATIVKATDGGLYASQAFDGSVGWERSSKAAEEGTEIRELKGAELDQIKLDSDFYREFKLKQLYPTMKLVGRRVIDTRETYLVEASPISGKTESMYFDIQTGLLIRRDMIAMTATGETPSTIYFADYRPLVGSKGLKIAFSRTIIFPEHTEGNTIFTFREARANTQISDSTFSKPSQ